jgi:hypothetical protein
MSRIDKTSNQLRWVIFLLAVAVILPTVCLLWFMTEAVKNERLAVRQKLIDVYQEDIATHKRGFARNMIAVNSQSLKRIQRLIDHETLGRWSNTLKDDVDGLVILDEQDQIIYPIVSDYHYLEFTDEVEQAFRMERNGEVQSALDGYQKSMESDDTALFHAATGVIRCNERLGLHTENLDFFIRYSRPMIEALEINLPPLKLR